jgi:hypothetical protein
MLAGMSTTDATTRIALPRRRHVLCCQMAWPFPARHRAALAVTGLARAELAKPIHRRNWPVFQRVLTGLHVDCPAPLPVEVRSGRTAAHVLGNCRRDRQKFVIRISNLATEATATDTLLHEWAHALAWNFEIDRMARSRGITDQEFQAASHGPAWGVAYSQVWQLYGRLLEEWQQEQEQEQV